MVHAGQLDTCVMKGCTGSKVKGLPELAVHAVYVTHLTLIINNENVCQPGLCVCVASLNSPGRLILSDLIGAGDR